MTVTSPDRFMDRHRQITGMLLTAYLQNNAPVAQRKSGWLLTTRSRFRNSPGTPTTTARSSNGRTLGSDPSNRGSNPRRASNTWEGKADGFRSESVKLVLSRGWIVTTLSHQFCKSGETVDARATVWYGVRFPKPCDGGVSCGTLQVRLLPLAPIFVV